MTGSIFRTAAKQAQANDARAKTVFDSWMSKFSSGVDIKGVLADRINNPNTTGYLPDRGLWEANLKAELEAALGSLPASQEAFNADLAARGIFSSGEAPKALFQNVYAPIANVMASATAKSNLGYAQMFQQGRIAEDTAYLNWVRTFIERDLGLKQIEAQKDAATWSGLGQLVGTGVGTFAAFA